MVGVDSRRSNSTAVLRFTTYGDPLVSMYVVHRRESVISTSIAAAIDVAATVNVISLVTAGIDVEVVDEVVVVVELAVTVGAGVAGRAAGGQSHNMACVCCLLTVAQCD